MRTQGGTALDDGRIEIHGFSIRGVDDVKDDAL
jgi:hypothetical protein